MKTNEGLAVIGALALLVIVFTISVFRYMVYAYIVIMFLQLGGVEYNIFGVIALVLILFPYSRSTSKKD